MKVRLKLFAKVVFAEKTNMGECCPAAPPPEFNWTQGAGYYGNFVACNRCLKRMGVESKQTPWSWHCPCKSLGHKEARKRLKEVLEGRR